MKAPIASAIVAVAALSSCAIAVVTLPIARKTQHSSQIRRRDPITEILGNNETGGLYTADAIVGTPPQKITFQIDTGSSDVWMLSSTADLCTNPVLQAQRRRGGCISPFEEKKSSTFKLARKSAFSIQYVDGTGSSGDYIQDTFTIGGATLKNLEMGIAYTSTVPMGIMGIGYDFTEASNDGTTAAFIYPSIIDTMVTQGLINTRAYSLYLDDLQEATGSIIFGGLDSQKYYGSLTQLPIVPGTLVNGSKAYGFPAVMMSGLSMISKTGQATNFADRYLTEYPVVLDSGSTVSLLDPVLGQAMLTAINGVYDYTTTGLLFVDCSLRDSVSSFNFAFGGTATSPKVTIKVPISELVYELTGLYAIPAGITLPRLPFKNPCAFGIMFNTDSPAQSTSILGDTFLRSAYVVYDLQNNVIGMAQTNFDSNQTNIVEFTANQTTIPNVPGVPAPASLQAPAATVPAVAPTVQVPKLTTSLRVAPGRTTTRLPPKVTTKALVE
ncbi:acid protease [Stipitochalara longipes BDJ]|nr:acid protease [Stipitochalara longipes BDJ]